MALQLRRMFVDRVITRLAGMSMSRSPLPENPGCALPLSCLCDWYGEAWNGASDATDVAAAALLLFIGETSASNLLVAGVERGSWTVRRALLRTKLSALRNSSSVNGRRSWTGDGAKDGTESDRSSRCALSTKVCPLVVLLNDDEADELNAPPPLLLSPPPPWSSGDRGWWVIGLRRSCLLLATWKPLSTCAPSPLL